MSGLRQLRIFVAVAEERNFTRAAERLSLSQQAVSRAITQLEQELGATLLERSTRDVTLTRAGEALLPGGRRGLQAIEEAFAAAHGTAAGSRGLVVVGMTPAVGPQVRTAVVEALRDGARQVRVSLKELGTPDALVKALEDRSVDIALGRSVLPGATLSSRPLTTTPASVYLPAEHPLALNPVIDVPDLNGERLMTWSAPDSRYSRMILELMLAAGARLDPIQAPVMGGEDPPLVRETRTVAILPRGWPSNAAVVERDLNPVVELPLFVLWRSGTRNPWAERVVQGLRSGSPLGAAGPQIVLRDLSADKETSAARGRDGAAP